MFALLLIGSFAAEPGRADSKTVDYDRDIRPILSDKCYYCHGPDKKHRKAKLRLDTKEGLFGERDGIVPVTPGKVGDSELFYLITSKDKEERMPPIKSGKKLDAGEIDLIKRWIEQGAKWQEHWAYVPPTRSTPPKVKNTSWPLNDIDRFILARLEREGLATSPEADRVTLLRRLSFDLIGLPPSVADVDAFEKDRSPKAFENAVDRLLASPHFGERMAVHWLDLVRFADTVGYHGDQVHRISPYRDYVIKAFNENMRYDQFTTEQLAGDLLPGATLWQKAASGYNRLLQTSHEGGVQPAEYLAKYSADRVRNVSNVWMGATMGCAECHDHKFDPYTQKDFYSLAAFFADVQEKGDFKGAPNSNPTKRLPEMRVWDLPLEQQINSIRASIADVKKKLESGSNPSLKKELDQLNKKAAAIEKQFPLCMVTQSASPRTMRVLSRGDWMDKSGEVVQPAVPHFLKQIEKSGRANRLDLAKWVTSRDNPLTARVFVNRLWMLFFGHGISSRPDDIGAQGEPPAHPQLLDWLAVEFVESGWDVKHMIKLMVMSRTYRQSSVDRPELRQRDPDNRLLARQSRFRLDAEFIRDNALSVSGLLVLKIGGPSAKPYQPAGYYQHLNFPKRRYAADKGDQQYRRGVYTHWQRQFLHPMLKAFDAPTREEGVAVRPRSNTPLAALVLLNDPTFVEAARVFAARIVKEGGKTTSARIAWAWKQTLSRKASAAEIAVLRQLYVADLADYRRDANAAKQLSSAGLAPQSSGIDVAELAAWTSIARALLNLNESTTRN